MKQDVKDLWYMIGTTVAVYGAIRYLLPLVVPFLFSYFFAKLLYPLVAIIKKKWKLSGGISITILMGFIVGGLGIGLFYLVRGALFQFQKLVKMFPIYENRMMSYMENLCEYCDKTFSMQDGTAYQFMAEKVETMIVKGRNNLASGISFDTIMEFGKVFAILWGVFVVIWGVILIVKDMDELKIIFEESWFYRRGSKVFEGMAEMGMAYGKAQLIIMSIIFTVCSIGFLIMGNSYAILLGLFVSVLDAFPVLGSGLILMPWAIIELFGGDWFHAAVLVTLFVICQVVREWTEAKLIGGQIGIKPIFTIMSMYAGVKLFGIFGFILGPIALMIVKTVLQNQW